MSCGLYGLVLCGGQSSRMGNDKGLLIATDDNSTQTWTAKAGETLKQAGLINGIFYSINPEQNVRYQKAHEGSIKPTSYIIDSDELTRAGPLHGILSAHKKYPNADWATLAVDMVTMSPDIFTTLITKYKEFGGAYGAYCYRKQVSNKDQSIKGANQKAFIEPLAAIYTSSFLKKIMKEKRDHSNDADFKQRGPTWYIQNSNAYYFDLTEDNHNPFYNANYIEDLQ